MARGRSESPDAPRTCLVCGRELPATEFYQSKPHTCKECARARSKAWREANVERVREYHTRYKHRVRGEPTRARMRKEPEMPAVAELPSLEVGKVYRIVDTGLTWMGVPGGDGNAKPVVYRGPCVARYGVNWAIETSNGIRCFTQGQLVGLKIEEVECLA